MPQDLQETLQNWRGKGRDLLEFVAVFPGIGYNTPQMAAASGRAPGRKNPLLTCHLFLAYNKTILSLGRLAVGTPDRPADLISAGRIPAQKAEELTTMNTNKKLNMTMLCDFYELTMGNGYFKAGYKDRITHFDLFFRSVPDNGGLCHRCRVGAGH